MPKPGIRKPKNSYKKIVQFMKDSGQNPFTFLEVVSATKVPRNTVAIFLLEQVEAGNLTRNGVRGKIPYTYRVVNLPSLSNESPSTVAEAVWEIFMITQSPTTRWDVRKQVCARKGRNFSKNSIDSVITRFTRKGALIKNGSGTYIRNPDFKERPTTTDEK